MTSEDQGEDFKFETGPANDPDRFLVLAPFHWEPEGLMFCIAGPSQDGNASQTLPWDEVARLCDYLTAKLAAIGR